VGKDIRLERDGDFPLPATYPIPRKKKPTIQGNILTQLKIGAFYFMSLPYFFFNFLKRRKYRTEFLKGFSKLILFNN